MTVAEIDHRMSQGEYVEWRMYYARKAQREELEMKRSKARARRR